MRGAAVVSDGSASQPVPASQCQPVPTKNGQLRRGVLWPAANPLDTRLQAASRRGLGAWRACAFADAMRENRELQARRPSLVRTGKPRFGPEGTQHCVRTHSMARAARTAQMSSQSPSPMSGAESALAPLSTSRNLLGAFARSCNLPNRISDHLSHLTWRSFTSSRLHCPRLHPPTSPAKPEVGSLKLPSSAAAPSPALPADVRAPALDTLTHTHIHIQTNAPSSTQALDPSPQLSAATPHPPRTELFNN
ncbi:hypothetical protein EKO04_010736 [Ascochyta lentis]|uniref:Uncharacterized protein n=1 Tax=Ascochyta lentis TaxID=205686 RepID=A0A8H7MD24_9PLEO|nr:hypothetical protein EKO04_010736 [Ascochyta lentis]